MNAAAAEALYAADLAGVRQIRGDMADQSGGMCAANVLLKANNLLTQLFRTPRMDCGLCGKQVIHEGHLVIHLNDDHEMTFSEIARKLGPDFV
jgi:hypothetical protein